MVSTDTETRQPFSKPAQAICLNLGQHTIPSTWAYRDIGISAELRRARDEVFRELGRNVLLVQQIELQLKFILTQGEWNGSFEKLTSLANTWRAPSDKHTLGQLAQAWRERHGNDKMAKTITEPPESGGISFRVDFHLKPQQRARLESSLKDVVDTRNQTIHHFLQQFSLATLESCRDALAHLQKNRAAIDHLRKDISGLATTCRDTLVQAFTEISAQLTKNQANK